MSRYIDADMLEKDGWTIQRIRQVSSTEMVYETKKPTDFPAADVAPRWIPVTERLPEKEGQYLVSCDSCFAIEIATYINDKGDSWFCCDWNHPENVVAWMPLPEPYKEGEQNE